MTIRHQAPDRAPIDLGGTSLTGMRPGCQTALLELLGYAGPIRPTNSGVDERILAWAGTDFRGVGHIVPLRNPHVDTMGDSSVDCWGVRRRHVGGEGQIV